MAEAKDRKLAVLFRAQLPGGDVAEYIAWDDAPGGAVRINGSIQEKEGDPLETFLRLTKARSGDAKA